MRARAPPPRAQRREHAPPTDAAVAADGDLGPDRVRRLGLELCAVTRLGRADPVAHCVEGGSVLRPREELAAEELEPVEGVPAEVVLAPLEHSDPNLAAERLGGGR